MNPCRRESNFDWIERGRLTLDPRGPVPAAWTGKTVGHLMPDMFQAYAKILHRLETRSTASVRALRAVGMPPMKGAECQPLRGLVEQLRRVRDPARVLWRQVAVVLDVPFHAEISDDQFRELLEPGCWSRLIAGPRVGALETEEYDAMVDVLSREGEWYDCYFRLPESPFTGMKQGLLFEGGLREVTHIPVDKRWIAPEYWWPADDAWCVCSDFHLPFTIVGASRRIIDGILSNDVLEAMEVSPDLRVEYAAGFQ